jgi:adenylyl-sulfate kinase
MIIWITGLSGSGKSTIAHGIVDHLRQSGMGVLLIDGDALRGDLCKDLGFSAEDRSENIRRAGAVAMLAARSGIVPVCSLISPLILQREKLRAACLESGILFYEIYVSTPLETCAFRDRKGLYEKARLGLITNFTGIDAPYEPPASPELEISTRDLSVEESIGQVISAIEVVIKNTNLQILLADDFQRSGSTCDSPASKGKQVGL